MPRVIDGDNLLGTWPGRSRSDAEKRALVRAVDALMRKDKRRIVVVFDGSAPPGVSYGPDVVFSGQGRKADAVILELLRREADPRGWSVVTNDRSLGDQCRFVGARVEPARAFRERLERDGAGEKPETPGDIDYWLDQFGGDDPDEPR
jgi:predicted RNA-binding protein with PIN domain